MKKVSFEEALENMNAIVEQLEAGNLSLEKSMELFQEGMKLSKICGDKLSEVETKIQTLVKEGESYALKELKTQDE